MRPAFRFLMRALALLSLTIHSACTAGFAAPAAPSSKMAAPPPNLLLLLVDDYGYECIGANGSRSYGTPHADSLAASGARFTHCYSQPLCTPTRVEILTGRYPFRNYTGFGHLRPGERTFAHVLRDAGYATGAFGKWQLDGDVNGASGQSPHDAGFDRYCLWNAQGSKGERYADPELSIARGPDEPGDIRTFAGDYGPDVCSRELTEFITESVAAGRPFLAHYPMILTHAPFTATPTSEGWQGDRHEEMERHFGEMVEYADAILGRLLRTLDELGVRENTLVLFMGDNGTPEEITSYLRDGTAIRGEKGASTDAGTHVPLVVSWPARIAPGQVRNELVGFSDFFATMLDAAGLDLDEVATAAPFDGISFLPALLGRPDASSRNWVLVDYTESRQLKYGWPRARFVRDERWKYYSFYDLHDRFTGKLLQTKTGDLYDVTADPAEEHPLDPANDDAASAAARERLTTVAASLPPVVLE